MAENTNLPAVRLPKAVAVPLAQPLADMDQAWRAAGILARSRLLPKALYTGTPEQVQANVTLVLWYGAELGLPPMQALQSIYVVNGKPQLSGQLWLSKVREAGHQAFIACQHCDRAPEAHPKWDTEEDHRYVKDHDETRCTMTIVRGDSGDRHSETFTIEDARRAKLTGKDVWQQWPKRMLQWRAASTCATTICPEVALGYGMEGDEVAADVPDPDTSLAQAVDARTEPPEPADVQDADVVADPDAIKAEEAADDEARQEVLKLAAEHTEAAEADPLHYGEDEIREGS
jgi:hypothetical protein